MFATGADMLAKVLSITMRKRLISFSESILLPVVSRIICTYFMLHMRVSMANLPQSEINKQIHGKMDPQSHVFEKNRLRKQFSFFKETRQKPDEAQQD